MCTQGVEVITNGSGSHHELRKLHYRLALMQTTTMKLGGVYIYSNLRGCDGERVYFDGTSLIIQNGDLLAIGSQFSLSDVEVITSVINLDEVRSFRGYRKLTGNPLSPDPYPKLHVPFSVSIQCSLSPSLPIQAHLYTASEEVGLGPACWCWDYLRRSRQKGFLLPLSGGLDSSSTAVIIANMCELVFDSFQAGNAQVQKDLRRIVSGDPCSEYKPTGPRAICEKLLTTLYMATKNSSSETQQRARNLANDIGSTFVMIELDKTVDAILDTFKQATGKDPKFSAHGGSRAENLALQNIQARSRMVCAYLFAQLSPWSAGKEGSYLVLGSANVDECLFGYLTKYDCSSADINPIGGINKLDLRDFILSKQTQYPSLKNIHEAPATAELEPITKEHVQTDEQDMGFTYEELGDIGRERKIKNSGPVSTFTSLVAKWQGRYRPKETADRVKRFYRVYSMNRHKATVLTPSYHAVHYSPDDNRFDLRPFLYNTDWECQFELIDRIAASLEAQLPPPAPIPVPATVSTLVSAFSSTPASVPTPTPTSGSVKTIPVKKVSQI